MALPILDLGRFRGSEFRPILRFLLVTLAGSFVILLVLGGHHVENPFIILGQITSAYYFSVFLFLIPFISIVENTLIELYDTPFFIPIDSFLNKDSFFPENQILVSTSSTRVRNIELTRAIYRKKTSKFHLIREFVQKLVLKWTCFQNYLNRYEFIRGFKLGIKETKLPLSITNFNNSIFIRIFRVIGGICVFFSLLVIGLRPHIEWILMYSEIYDSLKGYPFYFQFISLVTFY